MNTNQEKRVLFISYAFPPTGGAGVQRSTKFVKFLAHFGWQPTVLTVANPSVPVQDPHLVNDIPANTRVIRVRTWEPGYAFKHRLASRPAGAAAVRSILRTAAMSLLQPDPQVLWNTAAKRAACRLLNQVEHQAIFVTGPPFSSFLLGCQLKAQFSLPLILDFRDEWALVSRHLENHRPGPWTQRRQTKMRRQALRSADAIIATTQASARELGEECQQVNQTTKTHCIYNGFDLDDLKLLARQPTTTDLQSGLRLVYTGTLWNLTDIGPLVAAVQHLDNMGRYPDRAEAKRAGLELHIAGRTTESQDLVLGELAGSRCLVKHHGYLSHHQSLLLAASADQLLLTLADTPGAERVVPAKIFEYMALQKSILAIVPPGETRDILTGYSQASVFHPSDRAGIAQHLMRQAKRQPEGDSPIPGADFIHQFSRSTQAEQLASILDRVASQSS